MRRNRLAALGSKTPLIQPSKDMDKSAYAMLTPMKQWLSNYDDTVKTPISTMKADYTDKSLYDRERFRYLV